MMAPGQAQLGRVIGVIDGGHFWGSLIGVIFLSTVLGDWAALLGLPCGLTGEMCWLVFKKSTHTPAKE